MQTRTRRTLLGGVAVFVLVAGVATAATVRLGRPDLTAVTQDAIDPQYASFKVLAQDVTIPAGERARFKLRAGGFSRVSLLAAGMGRSTDGTIALATLFGPPLVPVRPPKPLQMGADGNIHGVVVRPVVGPVMVVVLHNDTSSAATITLSAYLTR